MKYGFPDEDVSLAPSWWVPLETVMSAVDGDHRHRFLDPGDLMVMARLVRPPRPSVVLYKHAFTRRYLNQRWVVRRGLENDELTDEPWFADTGARAATGGGWSSRDERMPALETEPSSKGGGRHGHLHLV